MGHRWLTGLRSDRSLSHMPRVFGIPAAAGNHASQKCDAVCVSNKQTRVTNSQPTHIKSGRPGNAAYLIILLGHKISELDLMQLLSVLLSIMWPFTATDRSSASPVPTLPSTDCVNTIAQLHQYDTLLSILHRNILYMNEHYALLSYNSENCISMPMYSSESVHPGLSRPDDVCFAFALSRLNHEYHLDTAMKYRDEFHRNRWKMEQVRNIVCTGRDWELLRRQNALREQEVTMKNDDRIVNESMVGGVELKDNKTIGASVGLVTGIKEWLGLGRFRSNEGHTTGQKESRGSGNERKKVIEHDEL